ncbi:hypothetical protein EVAR_93598_1 [Eumeta japonica]|uniref:Uncharacterized protein n=1 Tax=Eumeta variegata TaxID=151549 RepID=A0A4C1TQJ3_EUMVA|nr:hypothetical protein EVAR_93598_1 [Eumeta japonica]
MKHANKCAPSLEHYVSSEPETVKETSFPLPKTISVDKIEGISIQNTENSINNTDGIEMDNSCKNAIGGCIVTGDNQINENCLCIKMSGKQDHVQKPEDIIPQNRLRQNQDSFQKAINSCEDCDCSNIKNYNKNMQITSACNKKDSNENYTSLLFRHELNEINVKTHNAPIKDTEVPEDLSKNTDKRDIQIAQKYSQIDFDSVPFNSCKAILGNCIVSGDQTIGEGCLCAKMSKSIQHCAQEYEDITPFSEMSWSN